jgi:hypothetical protein
MRRDASRLSDSRTTRTFESRHRSRGAVARRHAYPARLKCATRSASARPSQLAEPCGPQSHEPYGGRGDLASGEVHRSPALGPVASPRGGEYDRRRRCPPPVHPPRAEPGGFGVTRRAGTQGPAFDSPAPGLRGPTADPLLLPEGAPRSRYRDFGAPGVGKKWRRAPWDAARRGVPREWAERKSVRAAARFTPEVRAVGEAHIADDPCPLNTPTKPSGRIGDAVELDL